MSGPGERAEDDALRAMLALDAGGIGSWRWNIAAEQTTGDRTLAGMFGLDFDAQPWPADSVFGVIHPDDLPGVHAAIAAAFEGGGFHSDFREVSTDPATGRETIRWLSGRGRITRRAPDGAPLEMIGVTRDSTVEKEQEARLEELAREMDHRVKNAFAVMRSLIRLGRRTPGDKEGFAETLQNQVQALADAHALTVEAARAREGAVNVPVPVAGVLEGALRPWIARMHEFPDAPKVRLSAEGEVLVPPQRVSALAMLAHELATNASKYGALSGPGGDVEVTLRPEGPGQARLVWSECVPEGDVLPEGAVPSGFGTRLIEHCVATLGGRVEQAIHADGLRFAMDFPTGD